MTDTALIDATNVSLGQGSEIGLAIALAVMMFAVALSLRSLEPAVGHCCSSAWSTTTSTSCSAATGRAWHSSQATRPRPCVG